MKTITLSKDHAFVRYFTVDCRKVREKVWRVRWRDFSTQKQDAEFETESEARAFAAKLTARFKTPPVTITEDEAGGGCLEEHADYWAKEQIYVEVPF